MEKHKMIKYHVIYFYHADEQDYGEVIASSPEAAKDIAARRHHPGMNERDIYWVKCCLTAEEITPRWLAQSTQKLYSRWDDKDLDDLKGELNRRRMPDPLWLVCADAIGSLQFDLVDAKKKWSKPEHPDQAVLIQTIREALEALRCELPGCYEVGVEALEALDILVAGIRIPPRHE